MVSVDLVIRGGTVVTSGGMFRANVAVKDGKIYAFTAVSEVLSADKVIDAEGLYVLPGVIDEHVHCRDPGLTHKEDFKTCTEAAAAGGVTTIFDMPNNIPPIKDVEALRLKIHEAEKKAIVDYGLYGLLTVGSLPHVMPLVENGVIGFKMFMGPTTGNIPPPSDGEMLDLFSVIAKTGLRIAIHAETQSIIDYLISKLRLEGRKDPRAHLESRPAIVEEEAIRRVSLYARETGARIHIVHVASARALDAIRDAKNMGINITAETCPHYLLLDDSYYEKSGIIIKVNPAIKSKNDQAALWDAINNGLIDTLGTDHAPHTPDEKFKDDVFEAAAGFPGLETFVPLMLTQVNAGRLSLTRFVQLTSENPAKAFGIWPQKGSLFIGSDADFTIVDLKATTKIRADKFHSKAKWSPFDGWEVKGIPVYTIVRGNIVMDHGEIITTKPIGKMVRPIK